MRTTIDAAGRIVVPKQLRDALGLESGTTLDIRVSDGRLEIEALPTEMHLVKRGRSLVATTDEALPPLTSDDVRAVLDATRR